MLFTVLVWLITDLLILLSVAFFTLFERNFIGLIHLRVGPNKIGLLGLLQPLLDAIKLLSNQSLVSLRANPLSFHLSAHLALLLPVLAWLVLPYPGLYGSFSFLVFLMLGSFIIFSVLLGGWASNSNYSLLGSLRSVSQSISYEAVFTTLVVIVLSVLGSYSVNSFGAFGSVIFLFLLPLWVFSTLAETHRAPFDFSESESELVSGFNTEYSGGYFAYLFLSEYCILILSTIIMVCVFFSPFLASTPLLMGLGSILFLVFFTWVRVTFCRFRYDKLMCSAWKSYLPLSLFLLIFYILI